MWLHGALWPSAVHQQEGPEEGQGPDPLPLEGHREFERRDPDSRNGRQTATILTTPSGCRSPKGHSGVSLEGAT